MPQITDDSNYELRISGGQKGFFVVGSPRGWVLGPRNQELKTGHDDHLTVGIDSNGEFVQIHRTVDDTKPWWHTEDSIYAEIEKFRASHSEEIDSSLLNQPDTYVLSFNRLNTAFSLLTLIPRIWMTIFSRFILRYEIVRVKEKECRIMVGFDRQKTIRLVGTLVFPIILFSKIVCLIPQSVLHKMLRKLFSLFLIRPRNRERLIDDLGILISPNKLGLLTMDEEKKLSFLSFTALNDAYHTVEQNLPLGKLSELTNFGDLATIELSLKKSQGSSRT